MSRHQKFTIGSCAVILVALVFLLASCAQDTVGQGGGSAPATDGTHVNVMSLPDANVPSSQTSTSKPYRGYQGGTHAFTSDPSTSSAAPPHTLTSTAPSEGVEFLGAPDENLFIPPDTQGVVGPNNVVELTNDDFAVYDRSGNQQKKVLLSSFWSGLNMTSLTDPRCLYDPANNRWFVITDGFDVSFGANTPLNGHSFLLVATSINGDPTGTWWLQKFQADSTNWLDYPELGMDTDSRGTGTPGSLYVSGNLFNGTDSNSSYVAPKFFVIPKQPLLNQQTIGHTDFSDPLGSGDFTSFPANTLTSTSAEYFVSEGFNDGSGNSLLHIFSITGATPSLNDLGFIKVANYASGGTSNAPQPGGGGITTNDTGICNAVFSSGNL